MKKHSLVLFFIIVLAFVLRFWQLGEIPRGLYQDETAIGYNAYSIAETGRDEHGLSFPVYFKSFGDWKLPVYIYSAIIPIKLFGLEEFAIRFPSAIFGFLTVIVFYFWVKSLTDNKNLALLSTFLLSINPWHLHYSRATFEVSIALFFFILGALFFEFSFKEKKNYFFPLAIISFLIAFYTYNLNRLLLPIILTGFLIFYRRKVRKVSPEILLATLVIGFMGLIPFVSTFFSGGGVVSAKGTLLFSSGQIQASFLELRSYFINLPAVFSGLFFNKFALDFWQYLLNLTSYFSVNFFFISGSSHGNHGIGNFGQFYLFEFPLIICGLVKLIQEKQTRVRLLILWIVVAVGVAALTREAPHATRSFFLVAPLEVLSAVGLIFIWDKFKKLRGFWKYGIGVVASVFVIYNIVFYFASYYVRFPIFYAKAWRAADKELAQNLAEKAQNYDNIVIDKSAGLVYASIIFYQRYPPQEFQKTAVWTPDDSEGFSEVEKFGKYEFRKINWEKDLNLAKTLFITTPDNMPQKTNVIKTILYPQRPVVLAVKEKIISYPVTDIAYVLVESNPQK